MRSKKSLEELRKEKEALTQLAKDMVERKQLETEVKVLKAQVKPSIFRRVQVAVGKVTGTVYVAAQMFDAGLQKMDAEYEKAIAETPKRRSK